jgi:coenzyme F420-reducing hydrogenase delta subunit
MCRYREGNMRAMKRLVFTQGLIEEIGLEKDRLELIISSSRVPITIDRLTQELLMREALVGPSPVRSHKNRDSS